MPFIKEVHIPDAPGGVLDIPCTVHPVVIAGQWWWRPNVDVDIGGVTMLDEAAV